MTVRDVILFGLLAALGAYSFREEMAWTRVRQQELRAREVQVALEVRRLSEETRALTAEARALRNDPYYVEQVVRKDLRWQSVRPSGAAVASVDVPPFEDLPGALAGNVPDLGQTVPSPPRPPSPPVPVPTSPRPTPPAPAPAADSDQQLLAALGYGSVGHFQRKMMTSQPSGQLDDATRQRIRRMVACLRRAGYTSVKEFQVARGLEADGICGRKTERAVIGELRRGQGVLVEGGRAAPGNGG